MEEIAFVLAGACARKNEGKMQKMAVDGGEHAGNQS